MEIVRKELEAKLAHEAEQAWLKAEKERLAEETESMKPMFKKHHDALSKLEAAALVKKEVCFLHIAALKILCFICTVLGDIILWLTCTVFGYIILLPMSGNLKHELVTG